MIALMITGSLLSSGILEFWNTRGVERFIDYVNEHYGTDEHPYFKLD